MVMRKVSRAEFIRHYGQARDESVRIREATSPPHELSRDADWYLTADERSGFGIAGANELVALFSLERGRGHSLVAGRADDRWTSPSGDARPG